MRPAAHLEPYASNARLGSTDTMNVLLLSSGRSNTGPAASACMDLMALMTANVNVSILVNAGTPLEQELRKDGLPVQTDLKLTRGLRGWLNLPAAVRNLRRIVSNLKIELVHTHRTDESLLARLALKRFPNVSLIRTWHRPLAGSALKLLPQFRKREKYVCVQREQETVLRQHGCKAAFLPIAVDTDRFIPRADLSLAGPVRIGLISRWKTNEDRGQRALFEIARQLPLHDNWRIVFLGRGEASSELRKAIAAHPRSSQLELIETNENYPQQVAALDVVAVFAIGSDGSSRAAVEALACGVPVLAADIPGLNAFTDPVIKLPAVCGLDLNDERICIWADAFAQAISQQNHLLQRKRAARLLAEKTHALPVRGQALKIWYEANANKD